MAVRGVDIQLASEPGQDFWELEVFLVVDERQVECTVAVCGRVHQRDGLEFLTAVLLLEDIFVLQMAICHE